MPRKPARTVVHVNQHVIKSNAKHGEAEPVLTVKKGRTNRYGHEVVIRDEDGRLVGKFRYEPEHPLSCGAKVWFETDLDVEVVVRGSDNDPVGEQAVGA